MRKTPFVNGEFYHIYNRGVDKRNVFSSEEDFSRFFKSMIEFNTEEPIGSLYENSFRFRQPTRYGHQLGGSTAKLVSKASKLEMNQKKLVKFICYCINPNHFHFILEQVVNGGISEFMKRLAGGYTWYFNNKHNRSGSLFQGKFKSIHIDSNEYLLHLSAYVNLNWRVHQLGGRTAKLVKTKFIQSSWGEYIRTDNKKYCDKNIIMEQFRNAQNYEKYALGALDIILEKKKDKDEFNNLLLE